MFDYAKQLRENFRDFVLVYISESPPTDYSISEQYLDELISENRYFRLNYSTDIIAWLESSQEKCKSQKI